MSGQDQAPWEIYSKTMFNYYGFPLWHADPRPFDVEHNQREIELGSVGYVDQGKFRHLFNARKPKDHPCNDGRVPATFEVFNPEHLAIAGPKVYLRPSCHTSNSVQQVVMSVEGVTR